tara:strand:+ start:4314 stop:5057 length:744 start_codon:yes stop_codon:yes gene_type:complete
MTTLLIDGDITLYQIASKCEVATEWEEGLWTLHSDLNEGVKLFNEEIERLQENLNASDYIVCLTGSKNFRKKIFPEYKANRVGKRKPLILGALRAYVIEQHRSMCEDTLEADDLLGLLSQKHKDSIIVSSDKDMKTIPCKLSIDGEETINVSQEQAKWNFYNQCLTGDATDNYSGCPNIGPAKASKILEKSTNYWKAIVETYQKADLTEQQALVQAQMAYILRKPKDYNFKTRKVKEWAPMTKRVVL